MRTALGGDTLGIFCESQRLYLRGVELSDSSLLSRWKNDPLVREMSTGLDTVITPENEERDIRSSLERGQVYCIIILKGTDKPIGYVRADWMDDTRQFAWLRFGLGEERGKGYSKEALRSFVSELFRQGVHRIDAEVYDFNEVSRHVLQSVGFLHEGARREAHFQDGRFFDILVYGLLSSDR